MVATIGIKPRSTYNEFIRDITILDHLCHQSNLI